MQLRCQILSLQALFFVVFFVSIQTSELCDSIGLFMVSDVGTKFVYIF